VKGYALSSAVPEAPLTQAIADALLANLRRTEAWWRNHPPSPTWDNLENVALYWSPDVGAVPADPDLAVVQLVPNFDGTPEAADDVAYHTTDDLGRPVCLISWAAVQGEGGTLLGPDGAVSAISHEIQESRVDPTCQTTVPLPGGGTTPQEVCDWVQSSDYVEPTSPGIYVANAVGPRFFTAGESGALDIASDVGAAAVTMAFQQTAGGYHEVIADNGATSSVFGDAVTEAKRKRIARTGPRGGLVRTVRAERSTTCG
jgi:hypothetical protein